MASPMTVVFQGPQKGFSDSWTAPPAASDYVYYAAHNPVVFKLQRMDRDITATANSAGFVKITISQDYSANAYNLTVGGLVYVKTGLIDGVYTVTNIIDVTNFVISAGFVGAEAAGFVNFNSDVKNFYFDIRMSAGNAFTPFYSKHIPDPTGLAKCDVSRHMRKVFTPGEANFEQSPYPNIKDLFLSYITIFDFTLRFDGAATDYNIALTTKLFACNASLAPENPAFNNMGAFVPTFAGAPLAKFTSQFGDDVAAALSDMDSGVIMWRGLPFDLQAIFSNFITDEPATIRMGKNLYIGSEIVAAPVHWFNQLGQYYINRVKVNTDACSNGTFLSTAGMSGWTTDNFVNFANSAKTTAPAYMKQQYGIFPHENLKTKIRFQIPQFTGAAPQLIVRIRDHDAGTINATTLLISAVPGSWHELSGVGGFVEFVAFGTITSIRITNISIELSEPDYARIYLESWATTGPPTANQVTEYKWIKIVDQPCNPVYLRWLGTNASWNHWCFGTNQQLGRDIKEGDLFGRYRDQYDTQVTDVDVLSKESQPTITCMEEQLETKYLNGLLTLLDSPKVFMLQNPSTWSSLTSLPVWTTVRVSGSSFKTRQTKQNRHNFEAKLLLPRRNIQSL